MNTYDIAIMTNQQWSPAALRPIARYKIGYATDDCGMRASTPSGIPAPAGAWVRYADHVAALVEAQPPAPSAAADLIAALEEARSAINSMKVEAETAGQGDEQMMLEACETISNEGLQADMAIRAALASASRPVPSAARPVTPYTCPKCHALWLHWPAEQTGFGRDTLNCRSTAHCHYCEKGGVEQLQRLERVPAVLSAPQPSPTPQADSQPALPEITEEDRSFLHYNPNTADIVDWVRHYASAAIASDRAARAPADSVTASSWASHEKALEDALRERDENDEFIDTLLDEVLGADRAEWSSAYGRADALNDVRERMTALHKPAVDKAWDQFQSAMEAPQQPAPSAAAAGQLRSDLVPGVMHCAKCKFQLNRVTLCVSDGNAYAGNNKTEPCPNGCGPLWPVTWEQEARNCWKALEEMHERLHPAPTPQADSQPAHQRDTGYPPLPRPDLYDAAAGTVGWSESALQGFVDADRAARAPADSVTAPAGGGVAGWLPVHFNGHGFYGAPLKTEAEARQYINQVHQSSDSVTLIARPFTWIATPPAQAADSVLEDAARLERERICAAIKAEDDYCVDHGDYMLDSDDCIKIVRGEWVRPDFSVDAARKQGANHD